MVQQNGFVTIKVSDVLGKEVANLLNEEKTPGNYRVEFNASKLASGIYFYRLHAGDFVETKKLIPKEIVVSFDLSSEEPPR